MKYSIIYIMIMFLGVMTVSAQSDDVSDRREGHKQKRELRKEFNESLSEDQKAQLEYQKQLRTEHKETWKATYTEEQLAIVQNEDLSRKGKHKALKSTLSDAQKEMKKSQKEKMKAEKSKFEASLSNEQLKKYSEIKRKKKKRGSGSEKGNKKD